MVCRTNLLLLLGFSVCILFMMCCMAVLCVACCVVRIAGSMSSKIVEFVSPSSLAMIFCGVIGVSSGYVMYVQSFCSEESGGVWFGEAKTWVMPMPLKLLKESSLLCAVREGW